ncbi:MAG: SH3 domain-containing protein [Desulfomonilia bacterium]
MKRSWAGNWWAVLLGILFLSSCAAPLAEKEERFHYSAPTLLPGTIPAMNTPGFWIGIHPDPDRVVIPREELAAFNSSIRRVTGMVQDLASFPDTLRSTRVTDSLRNTLGFVAARRYYRADGSRIDENFIRAMEDYVDLSGVPTEIPVRFALVTSCTNQRVLPTDEELYSGMKSMDLDRLQNSAYDIGTPLAVLHATRDGNWLYTITPLSEGWIRAQHVGFCTREQLVHYLSAEPFVVSTSAKIDLYLDQRLMRHHGFARMGCRFPSRDTGQAGVIEVLLPFRNDHGVCEFRGGFVMEAQVSRGYLPYTPRTVIVQAFKLLHSPYGWGDMYGEQDCSRFIQLVFSTVGIQFPRNSLQQAKVGRLIADFARESDRARRLEALSDASLGGVSILHMNGHIMLFLGAVGGVPYAIHDMRGYSEPDGDRERFRLVNRVVVSSLGLGEGTRSGSYLNRLLTVRAVENGSSAREVATQ